MCLDFYLVLFEQVGYSMFLVQYRKVFSDQYNFFERVDLAFALLYVYCVLRRMGGILSAKHRFRVHDQWRSHVGRSRDCTTVHELVFGEARVESQAFLDVSSGCIH